MFANKLFRYIIHETVKNYFRLEGKCFKIEYIGLKAIFQNI